MTVNVFVLEALKEAREGGTTPEKEHGFIESSPVNKLKIIFSTEPCL